MKKIIIGVIGVLSSVILFGLTLVAVSIYSLYLSAPDIGEYDSNLGVFGTSLAEIGLIPLVISFLIFTVGIYFLIQGLKNGNSLN